MNSFQTVLFIFLFSFFSNAYGYINIDNNHIDIDFKVKYLNVMNKTYQDIDDKLIAVNNLYNYNISYLDDNFHMNKKDHWNTPEETIISGFGDCEDYAIAKFYTLREIGIKENRLRLFYVKVLINGVSRPHMFLGYITDYGKIKVMDNLHDRIVYLKDIPNIKVFFNFNTKSLSIRRTLDSVSDPLERLSLFKKVVLSIEKG